MDNINENPETIPEIDPEKTKEETALEKMDDFFRAIEPGFSLVIVRTKPRELYGLLDEIAIEDMDSPVDLKYLIRRWGGRELRLLVRDNGGRFVRRVTIPLHSYPPLMHGKPIDEITGLPPETEKPTAPAPNPQPSYGELAQILEAIRPQSAPDTGALLLPIITAMIERKNDNNMDMAGALSAIREMREIIKPETQIMHTGGEDMLTAQLLDIGSKLLTGQKPPAPAPKNAPRLTAISGEAQPIPPAAPRALKPSDIASALSSLDGAMAGELFVDVLGRLTDDEKERAAKTVFDALGIEDIEDEVTGTE